MGGVGISLVPRPPVAPVDGLAVRIPWHGGGLVEEYAFADQVTPVLDRWEEHLADELLQLGDLVGIRMGALFHRRRHVNDAAFIAQSRNPDTGVLEDGLLGRGII